MPSPSRFRPRQCGRRLIVMSLGGGIKWNGRNCPHGAKMAAVAYPPPTAQNHRFPPPKSKAATPSPRRFRPPQRGRRLIVMSLGGDIKLNGYYCPHGAKMAAVIYPPECLKYIDSALLKSKPPHHPPAIPAQTPPP